MNYISYANLSRTWPFPDLNTFRQTQLHPFDNVNLEIKRSSNYKYPLNHPPHSKFPAALWKELNAFTKEKLLDNFLEFPLDLQKPYFYYKGDHGQSFVIDGASKIESNGWSNLRFGQNVITREFLLFKMLNSNLSLDVEKHPETLALEKLGRLKGIISLEEDNGKACVAMPLINGIQLYKYHSENLETAMKLALSYLEELELFASLNIQHIDCELTTMIDVEKEQVSLTDFLYRADRINKLSEYINTSQLYILLKILPSTLFKKNESFKTEYCLEGKDDFIKEYYKFNKATCELMKDRHEDNISIYPTTKTKIESIKQDIVRLLDLYQRS